MEQEPGRDYNRVVLAEDDFSRAAEMMQLLQSIGDYDVLCTRYKAEVERLLEETCAGWLLLDLNLADGSADAIVPWLRRRYGPALLILVLSGYYEDFPEYQLLEGGADLYLRKPYPPRALLKQMEILRARLEGRDLQLKPGLQLAIGTGVLTVDDGLFRCEGREITLPRVQSRLVALLASARDQTGWTYVSRAQVVMYMWGESVYTDAYTVNSRLRKLRARLRSTLGTRIIEVKNSGTGPLPCYRLSREVIPVGDPRDPQEG
jgi:DNA-binding response OmpR family regulator